MAAAANIWVRMGPEGLDWARRGGDGSLEATGHAPDWDSLSVEAGTRVVLVAPGSRIRVHSVDLPPASKRRLHAALPFALEDRLPGDPENYHLVPLPRGGRDRPLPVAVVEHTAMAEWLAPAREAGLRPQMLVPDFFCLPEPEADTWRVLAGAHPMPVRLPGARGLAAPADGSGMPAGLLMALEEADELPRSLELLVPDSQLRREVQEWVTRLQGLGVEAQVQETGREITPWLLSQPRPPATLNMLTGPYASREDPRLWLRRSAPAAGLAAGLLMTAAVGTWLDLRQVRTEHAALEEAVRSTYRDAFPEAQNLVDPRFQMEQRLEQMRSEAEDDGGPRGMLVHLARIGPALEGSSGVKVRRLRYEGQRLELALSLPGFEALESLRDKIGGRARLEEAELDGERVRARLIVGGGRQ